MSHIEEMEALFQNLGSRTRLGILQSLVRHGPLSVSELVELVGASQPNISHCLQRLSRAGLVRQIRDGREHINSIKSKLVEKILKTAEAHYTKEEPCPAF